MWENTTLAWIQDSDRQPKEQSYIVLTRKGICLRPFEFTVLKGLLAIKKLPSGIEWRESCSKSNENATMQYIFATVTIFQTVRKNSYVKPVDCFEILLANLEHFFPPSFVFFLCAIWISSRNCFYDKVNFDNRINWSTLH